MNETQEQKMKGYGLSAKAVNVVTKIDAERANENIWQLVETQVTVLLISPEMLATQGFQGLLQHKKFKARIFKLVVDEIHLLNSWGVSFRPMFQQIGLLRQRFPTSTSFLGMTGTLRKGKPYQSICRFLGLHPGKFYLQRRSNARPDIQLNIHTIHSNQATESFPELNWVLQELGKTLIFCPTIRLGFKLAVYFWYQNSQNVLSNDRLRLFNSLNSSDYNDRTLGLLRGGSETSTIITIATDKLSVGVDISDFKRVLIIDPTDLDDLWQKGGRVGRDRMKVKDAQVHVYIPSAKIKIAREIAAERTPFDTANPPVLSTTSKRPKKKPRRLQLQSEEEETMDIGLVDMITSTCAVQAIDDIYDNPARDTPCSDLCTTCRINPPLERPQICTCNYCVISRTPPQPEPDTPRTAGPDPNSPSVSAPKVALKKAQLPLNIRITQKMRLRGQEYLEAFRAELWAEGDELTDGLVPLEAYFPLWVLNSILDDFPTLLSKDILAAYLSNGEIIDRPACVAFLLSYTCGNRHLSSESASIRLFKSLAQLHVIFDEMRAQSKLDAAAKRKRVE